MVYYYINVNIGDILSGCLTPDLTISRERGLPALTVTRGRAALPNLRVFAVSRTERINLAVIPLSSFLSAVKNQSKPVAGNTTDYSDLGKGGIKTKDVSKSKKIVPTRASTRPPTTTTTTTAATNTTTATTTIRAATTTTRASTIRRTTRIPNARKNNRGSRPTGRRTTKKPRRVTSPSSSSKKGDKADKQEEARDGQVLFTCDFKRNERNCVMK